MPVHNLLSSTLVLSLAMSAAFVVRGDDWPQWRGPRRDGISRETGLLRSWPKEGPKKLWQVDSVGVGYSSIAVVDGRIYTQGDLEGIEHVICLDAKDGKTLWAVQPEPAAKLLAQRAQQELQRADKNNDGLIDESEGLAAFGTGYWRGELATEGANADELAAARAKRLFVAWDQDANGLLEFSEGRLLREEFLRADQQDKSTDAAALAAQRADAALRAHDADGDGALSRDEAKGALVEMRFGNIDRPNGDNKPDQKLTRAELEAYFMRSETGRDGVLTQRELAAYFRQQHPGRDGVLTTADLKSRYGGLRDGMGDGPRGTPTVHDGRVYVEGGLGDVTCLDAKDGKTIWHVHLVHELGGSRPGWGYSESPLVEGDLVIVTPGGAKGTVAALNKYTGEVVWRSEELKEGAHYASPIVAELAGVRQIVQFASRNAFGLSLEGKLLWTYGKANNGTANCATPIAAKDHVFVSSAYGTGGGLARIAGGTGSLEAAEVYFERKMANHHGGIILLGDYLYGYGNGGLICMNYLSGQIAWIGRGGKGSLTSADGMLYCLDEGHRMLLVEASPTEYTVRGEFPVESLGRPSWAHPVVAGGRLYIRNQQRLTAYDLRAE